MLALFITVSGLLGAIATFIAGRRVSAVEVPVDTTAEARLLAVLTGRPDLTRLYKEFSDVDETFFALPEHKSWWAALPEPPGDIPSSVAEALKIDVHTDDRNQLDDALKQIEREPNGTNPNLGNCDVHVSLVETWNERVNFVGTTGASWVENDTDDPEEFFREPLVRTPYKPTLQDYTESVFVAAFAALAIWWTLTLSGFTESSIVTLAFSVGLIYIAGASTLSNVDKYTWFLDGTANGIWAVCLASSIAFAALVMQEPLAIVPGLLAAFTVIALMEGLAYIWKRYRGVARAHALGDTKVIPWGIGVVIMFAFPATPSFPLILLASFLSIIGFGALTLVSALTIRRFKLEGLTKKRIDGLLGWLYGPTLAGPFIAWYLNMPFYMT